ncbi:DUF6119 family protein [Leptolyngbya sp. PCC 6406]|uniref:DUF6119 family protein n=1 Tax=Leptolyngbya sp. PCC 6406 TaxID=1173264 RepID=UPI0002ABCC2C|nr:DUF6119 family protein [Leptolyngbya sp. PCC 6406]
MPKYNLYRVPKDQEEDLLEKLRLSGLEQIGKQEIEGFQMKFFFSSEPDEIDIWWTETYQEFLGDIETPKNLMHFGVLLISGNEVCYAISLGKAHFYLSQFCDSEFGLNLAERIIDENDLKIKNSKYYKSARSKMITTYQQGSQITFDSGESMHYIKGKTIDSATWGKMVSFGKSVHLNIAKQPLEIPTFINNIEDVLRQPIRVRLPKVDIVKNNRTIQRLDRILARAILRTPEDPGINIEEFTMSGVDFIFADSYEYSLYLKGGSDEAVRLNELNLESLITFLRDNGINLEEEINNLKVKVHNEYGRDHTKTLKFYLDFIEEDERYCLIDGRWHKFNQSYVEFLEEEVNKIQLDYESTFDVNPGIDEPQFNQDRESDGYLNYDRDLQSLDGRYRVEKMDLYKDGVLYFVKKGTPQKLSYVIDQAINTVKILQNNADCITINDEFVEIKGICLWMILKRQTPIEKLSDINSIILHMKLVEWKKTLIDAGFDPSIKINYLRE